MYIINSFDKTKLYLSNSMLNHGYGIRGLDRIAQVWTSHFQLTGLTITGLLHAHDIVFL